MSHTLRFVVPGPPVPCARARVVADKKTGKIRGVTPQGTRDYEGKVRLVAQAAASRQGWRVYTDSSMRYRVIAHVYRARDVGDADNYAKALMDPLEDVVWTNDKYVTELHVYMHLDRGRPHASVRIERLFTPEDA